MTTWTPERITNLKKLRSLGQPGSLIASLFGNVTRNAILGKVHRLGLSTPSTATTRASATSASPRRWCGRQSSSAKTRAAPSCQPHPFKAKRTAELPPLQPLVFNNPPRIGELKPDQCCWPEGDPRKSDFHFCGRSKTPGRPYCAHHRARSMA